MYITITELRKHLAHYLELSQKEDVFITKNNIIISVLTNSSDKDLLNFLSLRGCLKTDNKEELSSDDLVGKEIMKKCGFAN